MRKAEIAGAGFAGLAVAALLGRDGWSVRVHEQSDVVREIGAGLFITHNGLLVLEELGLMGRLEHEGIQIVASRAADGSGTILGERPLAGPDRTWLFPRPALIDSLRRAALEAGAEIVTGSRVQRVSAQGSVDFGESTRTSADLVIGADGYRSAVRQSLGLRARVGSLGTTSLRFMFPGRELCPEPVTTQYWSGRYRFAVTPTAPDATYVYFAAPRTDAAARRFPEDRTAWERAFPALVPVLRHVARHTPHRGEYARVRCRPWHAGRVALLGDAAHALAPTLGQGTNLALANARSLVTFLASFDVPDALARWERAVRPVTDDAQRWSSVYDRLTKYVAPVLGKNRARLINVVASETGLTARMRVAAHTPPVTSCA